MTILTPPEPPEDFEGRVQAQVDEMEFQYASFGETPNYVAFAEHIEGALDGTLTATLVPADPEFWRAVAIECRRREAGIETPANRDRFRLIEE